jgi:hypothetical protein
MMVNLHGAVRFSQSLDINKLARSISRTFNRQDSLRTVITTQPGAEQKRQRVNPVSDTPIAIANVRDGFEEAYDAICEPFELSNGKPLARAFIFSIPGGDHIAGIVTHHIVSDMISHKIIWRDILAFYNDTLCDDEDAEIKPGFREFIIRRNHWDDTWRSSKQAEYWDDHLRWSFPATGHVDGGAVSHAPETINWSPAECKGLADMAATYKTTKFVILLSALTAARAEFSGCDVVDTLVSKDDRMLEFLNVAGCFNSAHPLRVDVGDNPTVSEIVARVKASCLGMAKHSWVPWEVREHNYNNPDSFVINYISAQTPSGMRMADGVEAQAIRVPGKKVFDHGIASLQNMINVIDYGDKLQETVIVANPALLEYLTHGPFAVRRFAAAHCE